MSREVAFWFGTTDNAKIPPRVMLRVFLRFDGRCQCGCKRKIGPGERWQCDHKVALINGGSHSEGNLQPLLVDHHKDKTRDDVRIKARTDKRRKSHYGIKASKPDWPCGKNTPFKKKIGGEVVRR